MLSNMGQLSAAAFRCPNICLNVLHAAARLRKDLDKGNHADIHKRQNSKRCSWGTTTNAHDSCPGGIDATPLHNSAFACNTPLGVCTYLLLWLNLTVVQLRAVLLLTWGILSY